VLFLTQDALPADTYYIEQLLRPFSDPAVALVSGRQIAKPQATAAEKWIRHFNYPAESQVRTADDIPTLGIKTFLASNVCSAYRRTAYMAIGGFAAPIRTNEDMQIAARLIGAGYKVAYCAEASVFHSHNFSLRQQFVRNYRIGCAMRENEALFRTAPAMTEGRKMAAFVLSHLWQERRVWAALSFCVACGVRLMAYQLGRRRYK
jgi:rhamnosyltransferase